MAKQKDELGSFIEKKGHGKRDHQKMKPYIVMQYLMQHSDPEHAVSAPELVGYLQELGIDAERRSIYRDIDEMNKVLYMLDNDTDMDEAAAAIDEDEDNEEKYIVFDKSLKGFYMKRRPLDLDETDIRLLAECVYSARFIDEKRARKLADIACSLLSEEQARSIKHDAFLVDRTKTTNTTVYYSVGTINEAMRKGTKAAPHTPEKISFKYLKYNINDVNKQAERRQGAKYVVSPYKLLINDGNYYLLAFDDKAQAMRTYRVDRMKEVSLTQQPRDGERVFLEMDMDTFTRRTFGMFSGDRRGLTLRFINPLLDTAIDRFGTKGVRYSKADDSHFYVETEVDISDQFFAWLCGFGNKVKIMAPDSVIDKFRAYIEKIHGMYEVK